MMSMAKKIFSTSLVMACFLCFFTVLSGCGETHSYQDVQSKYNSIIEEYSNIFSSGTVDINYSTELDALISDTNSVEFHKLSNDTNNSYAIFEPTLKAFIESINFYIDVTPILTEDETLPQNEVNDLYSNLTDLENKISALNQSKELLERLASTGGNTQNWVISYQNAFYDAISSANQFAKDFLTFYEENLFSENTISGRISPAGVQLQMIKNLADTADIFTTFTLSQIRDDTEITSVSLVNKTLDNFLEVKSSLTSSSFLGILSGNLTSAESQMIEDYNRVLTYSSLYERNKTIAYELRENYFNTLSVENKTYEQQVWHNKVNEFLNTDCETNFAYFSALKDSIITWSNS